MDKKYLIIPVIIFVLISFGFFIYPMMKTSSNLSSLSCQIPYGGGSCSVGVILPEGKAASIYYLAMQFDSVISPVFQDAQIVTHLDYFSSKAEYTNGGDDDTINTYLYGMPSWTTGNVAEIYVQATGSGSANADEDEDGRVRFFVDYIDVIPYPKNNIVACNEESSSNCPSDYLLRYYRDDRGDDKTTFRRLHSLIGGSVRIVRSSNGDGLLSGTATIEGSFIPLHPTLSDNKILVVLEEQEEDGATATAIKPPDKVLISRKQLQFINDMEYKLGGVVLGTVPGQQSLANTNDFSLMLNNQCLRDGSSIDECNVTLTFTSTTGGVILFTENAVYRDAVLDNCKDISCDSYCDGNVLQHSGYCDSEDGACIYQANNCLYGCSNGACNPDPCLGVSCGDGVCTPNCETINNCAQDCDQCYSETCGDGICNSNCETAESCGQDCDSCYGTICGDSICDASCEDAEFCPYDCGAGPTPTPTPSPTPDDPEDIDLGPWILISIALLIIGGGVIVFFRRGAKN